MAFLEKIGSIAKNVSVKAVDSIEINRIKGDIHTEKYKIEMLKQEVGEHYWTKYAAGEDVDPDVILYCEKIVLCHDTIRRLQAEIQDIQKERLEAESEDIFVSGKFCSGCGAPLAEGKKFCGDCGKPVEGESK